MKNLTLTFWPTLFFESIYMCRSHENFLGKESMLNFSRQAHTGKVTNCHGLFRILLSFEFGFFAAEILIKEAHAQNMT